MLGTILKDIEHSITFKIKCERPEIQDVNVFNSITLFYKLYIIMSTYLLASSVNTYKRMYIFIPELGLCFFF